MRVLPWKSYSSFSNHRKVSETTLTYICVYCSTLSMAHNKWKSIIKDPTVGGKRYVQKISLAESHFGLEDQTGEPPNIRAGFLKPIGGFGRGQGMAWHSSVPK